ncbi:MAG: DUF427 domain-containing protein [Acidiferrobacteraceae bacterium]|jgi:uncharacterized protein (DUF427 family)
MSKAACVIRKKDGAVLVRAEDPSRYHRLEGNWYFDPELVDPAMLDFTDRTYICPRKGTCQWIDLKTDQGYVTDAAWVYHDPEAGYESIRGRYGFFGDHRYYRTEECD